MLVALYLDLLMVSMVLAKEPILQVASSSVIEQKKIAITFDDGPDQYTEELLLELEKREVVASFFVTGSHARAYEDVIRQMKEAGHLIGNHTYSHMELTQSNLETYVEELQMTNEIIKEITGEGTDFVRPPYGIWNETIEEQVNMIPVLWTIDPLDWCKTDEQEVANTIIEHAGENEIILLHDSFPSSVAAALIVIDELLAKGYTFVTVDQLLVE